MATLSTGYRGNPDWRDMSEYAVHFTKASATTSAYDVMLKILGEGQIEPTGPLGAARNLTGLGDSQKSACFSEIPLDLLARLIARRSLYGVGFRQDFLINHGGARVWYLDKDGSASAAFQEAVRAARTGGIDPAAPHLEDHAAHRLPRRLRRHAVPLRVGARVARAGRSRVRPR